MIDPRVRWAITSGLLFTFWAMPDVSGYSAHTVRTLDAIGFGLAVMFALLALRPR